ncbi:MAG: hypothetical protein P8Y99_13410 [Calditrichaceae bacterium]
MFYSGIDLHKNMSVITTIDEHGNIIKQEKLANDEYLILNYFFQLASHIVLLLNLPLTGTGSVICSTIII